MSLFGSRNRIQHVTLFESLFRETGNRVVPRIGFVPCYMDIAGDFFLSAMNQRKFAEYFNLFF